MENQGTGAIEPLFQLYGKTNGKGYPVRQETGSIIYKVNENPEMRKLTSSQEVSKEPELL